MGAARLDRGSNFRRCSRHDAGPEYLSNLPQASERNALLRPSVDELNSLASKLSELGQAVIIFWLSRAAQ